MSRQILDWTLGTEAGPASRRLWRIQYVDAQGARPPSIHFKEDDARKEISLLLGRIVSDFRRQAAETPVDSEAHRAFLEEAQYSLERIAHGLDAGFVWDALNAWNALWFRMQEVSQRYGSLPFSVGTIVTGTPYPPRFTLVRKVEEEMKVEAAGSQAARIYAEAEGFEFVESYLHNPGQPRDQFFNPEIYVFRRPGGEVYYYSPEAGEIHSKLFDALSWSRPEVVRTRAFKQFGEAHSEIAEWYWTHHPTRAEMREGTRTPPEWVEEIAAKLLEIADRRDARGRHEFASGVREALLRTAHVLLERLPSRTAERP